MNFDFQKKFYKHLKKCVKCLLQNSKSNTIWWGKPYNFNFPRFWAKKPKFVKIHNWSVKFAKVPKIVKTNFGKVSMSKKITS